MAETFANNASGNLNATMLIGASSCVLQAGQGAAFPPTGNFRIVFQDTGEIALVGTRSGDTLSSITRGIEVTAAAQHNAGVQLIHEVTGGSLGTFLQADIAAKGDLVVGTAADTAGILTVGANGFIVVADSTQTTGVKWAGGKVRLFDSTLGADTANFDITSIDQSFAHLELEVYARGDTAAAVVAVGLRFNNDTAANYDWQNFFGSAAAASASESFAATSADAFHMPANTAGANLFGDATIGIRHYAGSTNNKAFTSTWSHKSGTATTNLRAGQHAGFWRSNSAISRITIVPGAGNFKAGSRCTLYGLS